MIEYDWNTVRTEIIENDATRPGQEVFENTSFEFLWALRQWQRFSRPLTPLFPALRHSPPAGIIGGFTVP